MTQGDHRHDGHLQHQPDRPHPDHAMHPLLDLPSAFLLLACAGLTVPPLRRLYRVARVLLARA
ncbi:hypothetical protein BH11PSE8_BH11PSE8_27570 [soil metagenome]